MGVQIPSGPKTVHRHVKSGKSASQNATGELIYTITNAKISSKDYNLAKYVAFFYRHRWQIESNFREIKQNFLGRTTSVRYSIKYFYFMFANVLLNYWILVNLLLELLCRFKGKDGIATYFFSSVMNEGRLPPDSLGAQS